MRITEIGASNFRSLDEFKLCFNNSYSAVCGKNNSGKSAVFRIIAHFFNTGKNSEYYFLSRDEYEINYKEEVTNWKKDKKPTILLRMELSINKNDDSSLYEFITRISTRALSDDFYLQLQSETKDRGATKYSIFIKGDERALDDTATEEIIRWLRDRWLVLYHDSTSLDFKYPFAPSSRDVFKPSEEELNRISSINKQYENLMNRVAKRKKEDIESILGNLGEKYTVNLEYPSIGFESLPYNITLGETKGSEIKLENWGSGTRNRTLILSLILRARQASRDINSSARFAPILIIEEPEAFLHPLAQSNFGRVIEDLSEEFGIQIIVTTHSPYLLNRKSPQANLLIEREVKRGKQYKSCLVDTSADNWMEPFALSLGVTSAELSPWHGLLSANAECNLVVEGEVDKKYLEAYTAKNPNILPESISINPIGGKDKLNDISMIRFISKFSKKVVFLLDLDAADALEARFEGAGLRKGKDFLFAGKDVSGKRRIEGLLPDELTREVFTENGDLVMGMQSNKSDEKKSASSKIKIKLLEKFEKWLGEDKKMDEFNKFFVGLGKCYK